MVYRGPVNRTWSYSHPASLLGNGCSHNNSILNLLHHLQVPELKIQLSNHINYCCWNMSRTKIQLLHKLLDSFIATRVKAMYQTRSRNHFIRNGEQHGVVVTAEFLHDLLRET